MAQATAPILDSTIPEVPLAKSDGRFRIKGRLWHGVQPPVFSSCSSGRRIRLNRPDTQAVEE